MKDLLEPLARLMLKTAEHCQIIVVSHAQPLVDTFARQTGTTLVSLEKYLGETIVGKTHLPSWKWPPADANERRASSAASTQFPGRI